MTGTRVEETERRESTPEESGCGFDTGQTDIERSIGNRGQAKPKILSPQRKTQVAVEVMQKLGVSREEHVIYSS